jgi:hypothetical protein
LWKHISIVVKPLNNFTKAGKNPAFLLCEIY